MFEHVEGVFFLLMNEGILLPSCEELILLPIQTQVQGFVCGAGLSYTLWRVVMTIVTIVAVEKDKLGLHNMIHTANITIWEWNTAAWQHATDIP